MALPFSYQKMREYHYLTVDYLMWVLFKLQNSILHVNVHMRACAEKFGEFACRFVVLHNGAR